MKIGVLTGGGDAPGLNAAIRAVARRSFERGYQVIGIKKGWAGLLGEGEYEELTLRSVSGILHLGGTILGTSRTNPRKSPELQQQVLQNVERLGLDALIAIGGDDTLSVAQWLYEQGVPVVGVPKTMDNDLAETDYCIGFNTAVSIVAEALDRLHTTATAHHRVLVVEVMGRDAGWVAVVGGLAGGADLILIPEVPTTVDRVVKHLERRRSLGKDFSIIVVAEGVTLAEVAGKETIAERDAFGHVRLDRRGVGETLARVIEEQTGFESRTTVLGHLQRGGSPSALDRLLATRLGVAAVDLVTEGKFGYMSAIKGQNVVPVEIKKAVGVNRTVDLSLYQLAEIFF
ncbi:MAG: 6-phosphofructokinase [Chloroflexi bacterium]|nr:6-phosphofructokinase [Chloroflexota bacterium]